jgi:hypothetical protein
VGVTAIRDWQNDLRRPTLLDVPDKYRAETAQPVLSLAVVPTPSDTLIDVESTPSQPVTSR